MAFKSPYRSLFPSWRMQRDQAMGNLGSTYADKVLGYGPIAYWPLWEAAGLTAECLVNSPAQDGTYTGVTLGQPGIGDGNTSPFFDGANDFVNVYSVALNAAWGGDEFTAAGWAKVNAAGVWTDGTDRQIIRFLIPGQSYFYMRKTDPNLLETEHQGVVAKQITFNPGGLTSWMHVACTRSVIADELKFYLNGAQIGATLNGFGAWAGALDVDRTVIGSSSVWATEPWHGSLAHNYVINSVLTQPQIADLATV